METQRRILSLVLEKGFKIGDFDLMSTLLVNTVSPRIMQIHLVQNSTSVKLGKSPKIFNLCKFIQLMSESKKPAQIVVVYKYCDLSN